MITKEPISSAFSENMFRVLVSASAVFVLCAILLGILTSLSESVKDTPSSSGAFEPQLCAGCDLLPDLTFAQTLRGRKSIIRRLALSQHKQSPKLSLLMTTISAVHFSKASSSARSLLESRINSSIEVLINTYKMDSAYRLSQYFLPNSRSQSQWELSLSTPALYEICNDVLVGVGRKAARFNFTGDLSVEIRGKPRQGEEISLKVTYIVAASIISVGAVAVGAVILILSWVAASHDHLQQKQTKAIEEVFFRVDEFVLTLSSFSLYLSERAAPERDTPLSIVERRLQMCLACLKTIAPSIPTLLQPHYFARQSLQIRSQSSLLPPVSSTWLCFSPESAVIPVSCVTIDITFFLEATISDSTGHITQLYSRLVTRLEETAIAEGGLVHFVGLDRLIAIWYDHSDAGALQAVRFALEAGRQMSVLRSENTVLGSLPILIGVTSGRAFCISANVVGKKMLQLFGTPLSSGLSTARINQFHLTKITCDENIRSRIGRVWLCKPIEVTTYGRVYEVLVVSSKSTDIEAKLAIYRKAFDLFEKRFFSEAVRAFQEYTKQYGYDSSVERIQGLLSEM